MKAFVLAAGLGTRLRPFTEMIPKPLMPVLNVPSLFYTLFQLKRAGIHDIICNIHHHADLVMRAVYEARIPGLSITFSEEPVILGTGGGLKKCEKLLAGEFFVLVNSDIVTDLDIMAMVRHHRAAGRPATLALYATPRAASIGSVGIVGDRIVDFANRCRSGLSSSFIYTGTAVLGPEIFRYLAECHSSIVDTGFLGLIDHGGIGWYEHRGFWVDIGTMQQYWEANMDRDGRIASFGDAMRSNLLCAPHRLADDAVLAADVEQGNSVFGSACRIGAGSKLVDSVILPGVEVPPWTELRGAIVGRHAISFVSSNAKKQDNYGTERT